MKPISQDAGYTLRQPLYIWAGACILLFLSLPLKIALLGFIFLLVARWGFAHVRDAAWLRRAIGLDGEAWADHSPPPRDKPWLSAGCGLMLLAFVLMEYIQPYYFVQDDAFCGSFPLVLHASRSLFSGVFPNYNPYQFLGWSPISEGIFALAYPPIYGAYAVARFALGNEYLAYECMGLFVLLQGFMATYWAARQWGLRPPLAMAAGMAFMLSGTVLIVGRSWSTFLYATPYVPLMAGLLAQLRSGPVGWRWVLALGAVIGLSFYTGFVQIWVYGLLWFGLGAVVLVMCREMPFRRLLWCAPGILLGIAIAAPLLYVQMDTASGIARQDSGLGIGFKDVIAIVLPYPFTRAPHPQGYGVTRHEYMGMYLYSGTILAAAAGIGFASLAGIRWTRQMWAVNIWLVGAFAALLLAFGDKAGLWWVMRHLPLFHFFRNAERFMLLFNLCAAIGGALVLQRTVSGWRRGRRWEAGLACMAAALMLYTAFMARTSLYFIEAKPYPPLPAYMAEALKPATDAFPQRIASLTPWESIPARSILPDYPLTLEQDIASVYGYFSMSGYDPMVWEHEFYAQYVRPRLHQADLSRLEPNAPAPPDCRSMRDAIYKAYGVQRVLVFEFFVPRFVDAFPELGETDPSRPVRILPVEGASPLAFAEANPAEPFPIVLDGHGATVDVSGLPQGGPFIVNILAWPRFKVYADGKPIPFAPDEWGRMRVDVPPGAKMLDAAYCPPWGAGFVWMLGLTTLVVLFMAILARQDKNRA